MGTSLRVLQAGRKRVKPIEDNDLSALRVLLSTGSPLMPEVRVRVNPNPNPTPTQP